MAATSQKTTRSGASSAKPTRSRRSALRKVLLTLAIGFLALLLALTIAGTVFYNRTSMPDPNKAFGTNTTFIYYRDGSTKIGSLSIQNRQTISYEQMPASIKDAVVAAENRTFWTDRGISPKGIARSAWSIARGGEVQGGSTITQQYIKVMYLTQDRTMTRKLRELALAVKMGRSTDKKTILAAYLNTVYFGRGAYGIQAAAKAYFNTDAHDLTVQQSAVLASIINNPSMFDPEVAQGNSARLLDRYHYVLDGMLADASSPDSQLHLTQAQHDAAYRALPKFPNVAVNSTYGGLKGYLIQMVVDQLHKDGYDDSQIQGGGLNVTTTFDPRLEAAAVAAGQKYERITADNAGRSPSSIHAAIASVQVGTGEVLAAYGGNNDYLKNSRNWATTSRPAASTFKAWATVAALRGGLSLSTPLRGDTWTPPGDGTPIRNEMHDEYGEVSLRQAVKLSINTAFVDAVTKITDGPNQVIKAAEDAGIPKGPGWDANDRIPLGTAQVSPVDNAGGYATIANEGVAVPTHVVKQVKDLSGKVIYTATTKGTQKIEKDIADDTNSALRSVVNPGGTGSSVEDLGYETAGKTGTAGVGDQIKSAWFVAYTRQISTAVMFVAGDDGYHDLDPYKRSYDGTFYGGTYPARAWLAYMEVAMQGLPHLPLASAAGVNGGSTYAPQSTATQTQTWSGGPTSSATSSATSTGTGSTGPAPSATSTGTTTTVPTSTHTTTSTATATHTATHTATTVPTSRRTGNGGGSGDGGDQGGGGNQPTWHSTP